MVEVVHSYTNIPHSFGLEALDYRLENYPASLHARFNKGFFLVVQNLFWKTTIWISYEFYNHVKGTATGTFFTPTYATLLMEYFYFQIKLYSINMYKYGEPLVEYIKGNCNRFLEYCCTVLRSS